MPLPEKAFNALDVASITTGIRLRPNGSVTAIADVVEWVMGPRNTVLAIDQDECIAPPAREAILAQHPELPRFPPKHVFGYEETLLERYPGGIVLTRGGLHS